MFEQVSDTIQAQVDELLYFCGLCFKKPCQAAYDLFKRYPEKY